MGRALLCLLLMVVTSGCCHVAVRYQAFKELPLAEQIDAWKSINREMSGICHIDSPSYLFRIADHGYGAANAMVPLLKERDINFPIRDVIYVLQAVQNRGCNLREHESVEILKRLMDSEADPRLREQIDGALRHIREFNADAKIRCPGEV